jgi:hypothetical protein
MHTPKTVYILGAGFSIPGGGPTQSQILSEIWNLPDDKNTRPLKENFRKFLRETLNVDEAQVTLEDIYTPIDRCLADGLSFKSVTESHLLSLRDTVDYLISRAIQARLEGNHGWNDTYIQKFAEYLVEIAAVRAKKAGDDTPSKEAAKDYDPFSVISLNWDILLDNELNRVLQRKHPTIDNDYGPFGVVDYCCHISSIRSEDRRIRTGLWTLGCRGYNIKLLKIHGSMNWLQCPHCQQLFIGFDEKHTISNHDRPKFCRHCKSRKTDSGLRGSLVMPTFLKDLSNFQIKLIWQNASVELMEAQKLVFVGYSLPQADFEFRQLISRMVTKDARIEVYLDGRAATFSDEERRYRQFFSKHQVNIFGGGAEEFVDRLPTPPIA